MNIGVLAIQGSVIEHVRALEACGVKTVEVRDKEDLDSVNGLILPGGESTTIGKLLRLSGLNLEIVRRVQCGMPIYGTCAGAILMARHAAGKEPELLRLMDINVDRNAYGGQLESFMTRIRASEISDRSFDAIFIRAPRIIWIGKGVHVLAGYNDDPVLVREGNMLVSTFHPELTDDLHVHQYFVKMVRKF